MAIRLCWTTKDGGRGEGAWFPDGMREQLETWMTNLTEQNAHINARIESGPDENIMDLDDIIKRADRSIEDEGDL